MSSISGINGTYTDYGKLASGTKLQTAADGAAELAIAEKLEMQATTHNVEASNTKQSIGMANIKDGALSGVNDYLGRIHELSIRSMSGLMSNSDKSAIQAEIDQLKQGIEQLGGTAKYNETYVLGENSLLKELGLEDYSIMGEFDLKSLEDAMTKVNSWRSQVGAETNGLEAAYNYLTNAALNTTSSQSKLEDLDYPEAISDMKKNQTLQQYQMTMQKKRMENEANLMKGFFI